MPSRLDLGAIAESVVFQSMVLQGLRVEGQHTGQTRGPCSRPSASSLAHYQSSDFILSYLNDVRGSSSSKFSKYLLPYLSLPIKVPTLVSPASCQHPVSAAKISFERTDVLQFQAFSVSRLCGRLWASGYERTFSWWKYSCDAKSVRGPGPMNIIWHSHLDTNLAQAAQRPHNSRHGGVVSSKSRSRRMLLLH